MPGSTPVCPVHSYVPEVLNQLIAVMFLRDFQWVALLSLMKNTRGGDVPYIIRILPYADKIAFWPLSWKKPGYIINEVQEPSNRSQQFPSRSLHIVTLIFQFHSSLHRSAFICRKNGVKYHMNAIYSSLFDRKGNAFCNWCRQIVIR